ncbi:MAG: two-component system, chemotaxis family, CheB/CheR fusion protein [Phycisphaerales bacterium]|jgi:PAS domain S-box-containing protein|nr:two-component system, chemotaxis family, CheB/CheR fusion protein [Phycisphaerales bacterium]
MNESHDRAGDADAPELTLSSAEAQPALLREAALRLAAIVESSDDAIVSKTLDGIIRTWNAGAERIFGYTAEEVIGRPMLVIIPTERQDEEQSILERLRRGERVDHFETVRVGKRGELIDVSVTISPIRRADGVIVGASKIARDITAQKKTQRELEEAKELAEAASRAKDHFLSVLSHELRTPLTPVLGALSLLERRTDLPDALRDEIGMLRRNVETEARLVDDLLDLTRISRGKVELHFEIVDVHLSLRNTLAMFQPEMDAKGLESSVALRARQHHVWADMGRLQQIFQNLIANAIKFTPAGGTISVRTTDLAGGQLQVEVRDTGIGIEQQFLERLFDPFEQAEQTTTRRFGGLGLGLSITRSLVEMHGGAIRAASEGVGRGAAFFVELATAPASAVAPDVAASAAGARDLSSLRVLLLEDHDDTRTVMTRLLASLGCAVTTASTVRDALALAERENFDLLVSDIGLPDGSGTEVMRHLRGRHGTRGIALSGFGQPEDVRRSEEAGFEQHLTKPINFVKLQDVIQKLTG